MAATLAFVVVGWLAVWRLVGPFFNDLETYAVHDWDAEAAYRHIATLSIVRYHEWPSWHPWFCGGFPAWGYVEGAPNIVSPYFIAYLVSPVRIAMRVEALGSTITALLCTYALAGRFTRSIGLRSFVALTWTLNGRWALQLAAGHAWHQQYAWLPLALLFFDIARTPGKLRHAVYCGLVLSLMAYMGAIYPLPHAALALCIYALVAAVAQRTLRPIAALAIAGVTSIGFAAPKILPALAVAGAHPRIGESLEAIDLRQLFTIITEPKGSLTLSPITVPVWGWHEYGLYGGITTLVAIGVGLLVGRGGASLGLRATAAAFVLLGMGSFHEYAPWTLLHKVPVFSSQHVPSRFLYPAVLFALVALAAGIGPRVDRWVSRWPWVDLVLLGALAPFALGLATNGRRSTERVFHLSAPTIAPARDFHHETSSPYAYTPPGEHDAMLLAMFANTGVVRCYGVPYDPANSGALAKGGPTYTGEAYFVDDEGKAVVSVWTPSSAVIEYAGARPGATLVYNMNYDVGWRADGAPAFEQARAVATRVTSSQGRVRLEYRPPGLRGGLALFAATVFACFIAPPIVRRWRARRKPR